jgi:hypothetical protein
MYAECLRRAKVEVWIDGKKKKKRRVMYKCACCGELFHHSTGKREIAIDHIQTVVPLEGLPMINGLPDFNVYIARLFCSVDNLQVLCLEHHKLKTRHENAERKRLRDEQSGKPPKPTPNKRGRKQPSTKKLPSKGVRKSSK